MKSWTAKETILPATSPSTSRNCHPLEMQVPLRIPELEAYAIHLAKLVPTNVSPLRPSVTATKEFLLCADLPIELVAFTACILDALTERFAIEWRNATSPPVPSFSSWSRPSCPSEFFTTPAVLASSRVQQVDPSLIILAALSLAYGFLSDATKSNRSWAIIEGNGAFTARQIEATRRTILKDIDYGLQKICGEMVEKMVKDLQSLTRQEVHECLREERNIEKEDGKRHPRLSLDLPSRGVAVWQFGVQTPEPSP
ncbi:hypothetical protein K491DRAFT_263130 [Lophiostoma macrostomum CBS 122681]|uniref:Cyclin N-terminal domain-containing protein n=1 Tax=Lophiostoma macrostomum CBS 122681 TaxID=1314788 RepID=A0A6A6SJX3_9PLEO|nr:hypothetical protein K491DRAFT_263130 [Lophiostoma macrostomum CBS 122681]